MENGITNVRDSGSKRAVPLSFATEFKEINEVIIRFKPSAFSKDGTIIHKTLSAVISNYTT